MIGGQEGEVDFGLQGRAELDLGFFGGLLQALDDHFVAGYINALVSFELGHKVIDDALVDVVAAQMGVAIGRNNLDHVFTHLQDRDVEGAAAEVVDRDDLVCFLLKAVCQGRCRRFIDDAFDFQAGDGARVLGGLSLAVVEVSRHGDDRIFDFFAQVVFGGSLELLQDFCADFRRAQDFALNFHLDVVVFALHDLVGHQADFFTDFLKFSAHEPLDGEDSVLWVGHRLSSGYLTDQDFAVFLIGHHRRRGAVALFVGDNFGCVAFHDGHHGVCGAQVDPDAFAHHLTSRKTISFCLFQACHPSHG